MKRRITLALIRVILLVFSSTGVAQAYYSPETGNWPSRDPIGEQGGENLYAFVNNASVSDIDYLGQKPVTNPGGTGGSYVFVVNGLDDLKWLDKNCNNLAKKFDVCLKIGHPNPNFSGECATCCQLLTCDMSSGEPKDAPSTKDWIPGDSVTKTTPAYGTMIAIGWVDGKYPNTATGNHTAIYLGPGKKAGYIRILSQNNSSVNNGCVGTEEVPAKGWRFVTSNKRNEGKKTKCTLITCKKDGTERRELTIEEARKLYKF